MHRFAIFCDRAPGDVYAFFLEAVDDGVIRKHGLGAFLIDYHADAVAHRFGRTSIAVVGRADRGREEIFQPEQSARGQHVFVGGSPSIGSC